MLTFTGSKIRIPQRGTVIKHGVVDFDDETQTLNIHDAADGIERTFTDVQMLINQPLMKKATFKGIDAQGGQVDILLTKRGCACMGG